MRLDLPNQDPLVIVVAPVDAPGHYWECGAYICEHTGWRCEREFDEAMPDFVQRVEREAEQRSKVGRYPLMLMHPDTIG